LNVARRVLNLSYCHLHIADCLYVIVFCTLILVFFTSILADYVTDPIILATILADGVIILADWPLIVRSIAPTTILIA